MATLFDQAGKITPGVGDSNYSDTPEWGGRTWRNANTGAVIGTGDTTTGAQKDVNYYQGLGQQWANQAAPTVDYDASNGSLYTGLGYNAQGDAVAGNQASSLADVYRLASGQGPSIAGTAAQNQVQSGINGAYTAAGSALGGSLGQAAAMRSAAQGQAGMQAQGQQQVDAARANEMAQYRQLYSSQVNDLRNGNQAGVNAANASAAGLANNAQAQATLQQGQNKLDQQGQLWGEEQAFNVNQAQLSSLQAGQDLQAKAYEQRRQATAANNAFIKSGIGAGIGMVTSAVGQGASGSDTRIKESVSLGKAAEMRLWR